MSNRPVFRASTVFPVFCGERINTQIGFLNYWSLKGIQEMGAIYTLRDQDGNFVDRMVTKLIEPKTHNVDCGAMLHAAGVDGEFVGTIEFEAFSGQNVYVPTPAVIGTYLGDGHMTMVHAYTRTYNDYEEEQQVHPGFSGENYGWVLFDDEEIETYFVLINGPKEIPEQQITMDLYNDSGEHRQTTQNVETLPPYACRVYTAAGDNNIVDFLGGKPGWMKVNFRVDGIVPLLMGGAREKNGWKLSTAHAYSHFRGRDLFFEPEYMADEEAPYHLPVSVVAPHLPPKIFIYPDFGEADLVLDLHLYDADGHHLYGESGSIELNFDGSKMHTIDCAQWVTEYPQVALIDFVARFQQNGRVPSRLHCSIQYGETNLEMCMAEAFKFYTKETDEKRLRWGMVEQNDLRRSYISIRNVGFDPEESGDVHLDLALWRSKDSESLHHSVTIPANGSLVSAVDQIFPEAKKFLEGEPGWYSTDEVPRSIKTMTLIEDIETGMTSGEHGH